MHLSEPTSNTSPGGRVCAFTESASKATNAGYGPAGCDLARAAEAAEIGIWSYSLPEQLLRCNEWARVLHGFDTHVVPLSPTTLPPQFCPEDLAHWWEAVEAATLPEGDRAVDVRYRVKLPDGSFRWIRAWGRAEVPVGNTAPAGVLNGVCLDITSQVLAEQAFRATETRLQALASASFEGVAITEDGRFIEVNEQLLQMLGYAREEILGRSLSDILPPEAADRVLPNIQAGRDSLMEHEIRRKDGTIICIEARGRMLHYQQRNLRFTAIRDITERRRAEQELRASEERFRATFDLAPVGIAHVGLDGRFLRLNDALCRITGYSREELERLTFVEITHPEDVEADWAQARALAAGQIQSYSMEKRYVRKDGSIIWIELTGSVVRDSSGAPVHYIAAISDIHHRKQAERELRLSEQKHRELAEALQAEQTKLRAVIENLPIGLGIGEPGGKVLSLNPAGLEMHGCSSWAEMPADLPELVREFELRHLDGSLMPVEHWPLSRAGRGEYVKDYEVRLLRKSSGLERTLLYNAAPVRNARGETMLVVYLIQDVTRQRQTEEAIRQSEERFRRLVEVSSQIVWVTDAEGRAVEDSPSWRAFTGRKLEQWLGDGWLDAIHPEDRARLAEQWANAVSTGTPYRIGFRQLHHSGEYRHLQCHAVPIKGADGRIREWIGMNSDVQELKLAEAKLQERERQLRLITDSTPALISYIDHSFRYRFLNRQYEVWFGHDREKLLGASMAEVLGEQAFTRLRPFVERVLQGEEIRFELETPYRYGGTRWIDANYVPDIDSEGRVAGFFVLVLDVSERKRAELALRQSEEQLRLALNTSRAFVWSWELENGRIAYSSGSSEVVGSPAHVHISETWNSIHPDDLPMVQSLAERAIAGQVDYECDLRVIQPKTGAVVWLHSIGRVERDLSGKPLRMVGIATDITARKQAEAALRQSEEHARRILDNTLAFVGVLSLDGVVIEANATALKAGGLTREDVIGRKFWDCFWWDYDPQVQQQLRQAVRRAASGAVVRYDVVVRMFGDTRMPIDFMVAPARNAAGEITHLIPSAIDITERKRAETALRESEARLRIAKTAARLGVYDRNLVTGEMRWDLRTREVWGFDSDENISFDKFLAAIHPDDRSAARSAIDRATDPGSDGVYYCEYRVIHPRDGKTRWVAASGQAMFENGRAVRLVGTVQEITDRKEFEAELERLVAERTVKLQELVGELEHFSYTITHDMRAPLRAMRGFAELIAEMLQENAEPDLQIYLDRIIASAERMDLLITDALNYSKAVRQELALAPVDLGRLLREILDSYPEFQPSRADICLEESIPLVLGNEAGLTQCFANLIGNAVKFVPPGARPEVRVWSELRDGWVRICVEDKGIGISPSMLPRVFEMFTRGQHSYDGTGIGLALVRKVVDRMRGRVGVESEQDKGSRFWVDLQPAEALLRISAGNPS